MNLILQRLTSATKNRLAALFAAGFALTATACGAEAGFDETIAMEEEEIFSNAEGMRRGDYLYPNQELYSQNCAFKLRMETNGNLRLLRMGDNASIWEMRLAFDYPPGAPTYTWSWAAFQSSDGNFVVYDRDGEFALWDTNTSGESASFVRVHDTGRWTVRSNQNVMLWQSSSNGATPLVSCIQTGPKASSVTKLQVGDRPGMDLPGMPLIGLSRGGCGSECSTRGTACNAWTYIPKTTGGALSRCFLKSGIPPISPNSGMISGEVQRPISGLIPVP